MNDICACLAGSREMGSLFGEILRRVLADHGIDADQADNQASILRHTSDVTGYPLSATHTA